MSCAELIASADWARTPLGPREQWPIALRATVDNMLRTKQPMLLFWGPEWTQLYNDAFVPSFGNGKHPVAMGQSARECWADAWPIVGAQLEAVVRGEPAWHEDTLVPIFRNGRMEEVFWTYSYSPAVDDRGAIAGVLVIVTETTGRMLSARRLAGLARTSAELSAAVSTPAVADVVLSLATRDPHDIPFIALDIGGHMRMRRGVTVDTLDASGTGRIELPTPIPIAHWPEPVTHVYCVEVRGLRLTFGLSPRLLHDEAYLGFLTQLAEQAGSALHRIVTAREQQRADAERTAMLAALDEANRAKDEFLAMLGHELRNPLAPIVAALELMKAKDPVDTPERAAIERQVDHVVRLVDDLLDVARIARGQLELSRKPTDLSEIVTSAVEITNTLVAQRNHTLTVDVEPGITLDADPTRLVQIVSNLLVNAARYTPPRGTIELSARRDGDAAVLRVRDTGQGIAAELLPRIFDLFVQGKRSQGGLGIGLALVKNFVVAHGGTIAVTSDGEGRGSTFTIRLPLPAATNAVPRTLDRTTPLNATLRRVLLVDDNEDAAQLLADIIRTRGHEVVVAHHPNVALDKIRSFTPDIAVVDIGLPGLDGYELGRRIRDYHPQCRVVALTGYGQARDRQRSIDAGFFAHLVKPVRVDAFLELLG